MIPTNASNRATTTQRDIIIKNFVCMIYRLNTLQVDVAYYYRDDELVDEYIGIVLINTVRVRDKILRRLNAAGIPAIKIAPHRYKSNKTAAARKYMICIPIDYNTEVVEELSKK